MAFTDKQAKAKARQIFDRFGGLIHAACVGTGVSESFLAGFTGVEAGIDHHGNITPNATRFEPGVYADLISLRDNGYCFISGKKHTNYSGVRREQIADSNDAAIRALATSYCFSQIMGWHCINDLKCTIAELRDPDKHFSYTIQLLKIVGGVYMKRGQLEDVLHIWNTGNANGKTYHEDYVVNALKVKSAYDAILASKPAYPAYSPLNTSAADASTAGNGQTATEDGAANPVPDGNALASTEQPPPSNTVVVEKEQNEGFFKKIWKELTGWSIFQGGLQALQQYKQQIDDLGLPGYVIKYVIIGAAVAFVGWFLYRGIQHLIAPILKRWLTVSLINANTTPTNSVTVACKDDIDRLEAAGYTVARRQ